MTNHKPITAIHTIYRGIEFRSRMEAQCAVLLDKIGWEWEYEKYSFTLDSGVSFRPDFWIKGSGMLLECRGYDSDLGERQIQEFGNRFLSGKEEILDLPDGEQAIRFIALGPEHPRIYSHWLERPLKSFVVSLDHTYQWWNYLGSQDDWISYSAAITIGHGKIFVNHMCLEDAAEFSELCEMVRPAREIRRKDLEAALARCGAGIGKP